MKPLIIFLLFASGMVFAQTDDIDSTVTRIPMSKVRYYDLTEENLSDQNKKGVDVILGPTDKPFSFIQPKDKWFSRDKWMHLTSSYFLTLQSAYALDHILLMEPDLSRQVSVGITFSFSLGKEFYDVFAKGSYFSWKDLTYDLIGTVLGYLTSTVIQN